LAQSLQVAFDAGEAACCRCEREGHPDDPRELFAKFQTGFYADPVDAVSPRTRCARAAHENVAFVGIAHANGYGMLPLSVSVSTAANITWIVSFR
jgi:hypothetical protein